jgi:hypothetical protein
MESGVRMTAIAIERRRDLQAFVDAERRQRREHELSSQLPPQAALLLPLALALARVTAQRDAKGQK